MPAISVVIPLYNKSEYVLKAIHSVLAQSFLPTEIIVINDGSTDNSLEVIEQINDDRIIILNQRNEGVSVARNVATRRAVSEYVAFLDADDWWDKHFLESMMQLIVRFPNADLYGSNYYIVKNQVATPAKVGVADDFEEGYINYFEVYSNTFWVPINCSFAIVRKEVFLSIGGFKPNLKFGEDLDLWIRMALKSQVAYVNKRLAYSNQDVDLLNRALAPDKQWKMEEHVIFNLSYILQEENQNRHLKKLVDGLIVRLLLPFYLSGNYKPEVHKLINRVDFKNQPFGNRLIYFLPKSIIQCYFSIRSMGSKIKRSIS